MITFSVTDMSCSHCAGAITHAVQQVDQQARVDVDLERKLVRVDAARAGTEQLRAAITDAGYTPVAVPG